MNQVPQVDSPFLKREPVRLAFGTLLLMLLTVVGAGIGLLVYYAMRVPAITSELNAWLGRPDPVSDSSAGRAAQVTFVLFVYTAPLALGIFVSALHSLLNWLDRRAQQRESESDEQFRME
jgi:hypothetical protein